MLRDIDFGRTDDQSVDEEDLEIVQTFQAICAEKNELIKKNVELQQQNAKLLNLIFTTCEHLRASEQAENKENLRYMENLTTSLSNLPGNPIEENCCSEDNNIMEISTLHELEAKNNALKKRLSARNKSIQEKIARENEFLERIQTLEKELEFAKMITSSTPQRKLSACQTTNATSREIFHYCFISFCRPMYGLRSEKYKLLFVSLQQQLLEFRKLPKSKPFRIESLKGMYLRVYRGEKKPQFGELESDFEVHLFQPKKLWIKIKPPTKKHLRFLLDSIQISLCNLDQPLRRNYCGHLVYKKKRYFSALFEDSLQLFRSGWSLKPRYRFVLNTQSSVASVKGKPTVFVLHTSSVSKNSFICETIKSREWWIRVVSLVKTKEIKWDKFD